LKSELYLNLHYEWSTDRFLTNTHREWLGSNINYKINNQHQLLLFLGQSRGGPACNAGICYETLDFSGIEFRWLARL
ncbi:MAG: hypothetical protein VW058_09060, partial [Flavobacteriaceae bacterium]